MHGESTDDVAGWAEQKQKQLRSMLRHMSTAHCKNKDSWGNQDDLCARCHDDGTKYNQLFFSNKQILKNLLRLTKTHLVLV